MNSRQEDVHEFHVAMDHPAPKYPVFVITEALRKRILSRAEWLHEEADELIEAVNKGDLVGVLDAYADSEYFALGGFVELGHDSDHIWGNVQGSNMAKLDPETGKAYRDPVTDKIQKPADWVAPEAAHRAYLEELNRETEITGLALQIAFQLVTNPDGEITMPKASADFLVTATERALLITRLGADQVIADYNEMAAEAETRG
ncbi:MazG-like nucleotide pyrophosphohydrolase [Microbacterium phage Rasputia]|nr:MazG-like nucleotide pyrophosphohydrolase [Microbacterium phage Rasputia]